VKAQLKRKIAHNSGKMPIIEPNELAEKQEPQYQLQS